MEIGGEERRLIAAGAGSDFHDAGALVERVLRHEQGFERLFDALDLGLHALDFSARFGGELRVVGAHELARLLELMVLLFEPLRVFDDGREALVLTAQRRQSFGVSMCLWVA
jgi:hypothetical protein